MGASSSLVSSFTFLVWLSRLAQPFPEVFLPALRQFFHSQGHGGGDAKGSGGTRAFLEVLNVKAEGSGDEYTGDLEASDDAMELGEAAAEAFGELHGAEQEGAGAHQAVRQEPPSEGLDVRPFRILGINEEMLVMAKNVGEHDADDSEQNIFWARPHKALGHHWAGRQFFGS